MFFMAFDGLGSSVGHVFDSLGSSVGGVTPASSMSIVWQGGLIVDKGCETVHLTGNPWMSVHHLI